MLLGLLGLLGLAALAALAVAQNLAPEVLRQPPVLVVRAVQEEVAQRAVQEEVAQRAVAVAQHFLLQLIRVLLLNWTTQLV